MLKSWLTLQIIHLLLRIPLEKAFCDINFMMFSVVSTNKCHMFDRTEPNVIFYEGDLTYLEWV